MVTRNDNANSVDVDRTGWRRFRFPVLSLVIGLGTAVAALLGYRRY